MAIFSALFIVVFMALLSGAVATLSANAHRSSAADMVGVQAMQAARAGSEWGLNRAWNNDAAVCTTAGAYSNFAAPLFGGMSVTVHCLRSTVDEIPVRTAFAVTAWACNLPDSATGRCPGSSVQIGGANYVERKVFAMVER